MNHYILFIIDNATSEPTEEEWQHFFAVAHESALLKGGSEIGDRGIIGDPKAPLHSRHIVGYMRFDAPDSESVLELLKIHPVVLHGGSVELCEMRRS